MESSTNKTTTTPPTKPKIIILSPPSAFLYLEPKFSNHYHFLKAYDSPLRLPHFLANAYAAGVSAMFTAASGPRITESTVLRHIPSLRIIVVSGAGTDNIELDDCRRRGVAVTNAADVYSDDCADLAVGLLFDVLRKVSSSDRFVRNGAWQTTRPFPLGYSVGGKRVGIVGLGSIGSRVATRLKAFGCRVTYISRTPKQSVSYPFYSNIHELATNSDVLVICCALTYQTRHMINKDVLSALGQDGILVNIARGAVVDEGELLRCLVDRKIAGAGLDVFEDEPSVPEELICLDNVVLSPHHAFFTPESFNDMYEHVIANFEAFFSGNPLLSPVL